MLKGNSQITFFVVLLRSLDRSLLSALFAVCLRIMASLREFSRRELTPRTFQGLELRLERLGRELARVLLQHALNRIEASSQPDPIQWEYRTHRSCSDARMLESPIQNDAIWNAMEQERRGNNKCQARMVLSMPSITSTGK